MFSLLVLAYLAVAKNSNSHQIFLKVKYCGL